MNPEVQSITGQWLEDPVIDQATKDEIIRLQSEDEKELVDSFYKELEFGTGGLRGIMGVGSNRMNKYTVGKATQGFANYLKANVQGEIKVAIAHDSRNNSTLFAETTANVFAANGIKVFLFDGLRPTPELSFAIRQLGCHGGVVLTASHNPKEYNGYKAYWADGGQLVPPHDKNVITEVNKITNFSEVKFEGGASNIEKITSEVDEPYLEMLKSLSVNPEMIKRQKDLKIVFTPIHGTGIVLGPKILEKYGFENVTVVEEQAEPNGNFPTVVYPNPEEAEALSIGLAKAKELDADILLGTDPDADRVGIAVKDNHGEWVLLNGNQTASLLFNYVIKARKDNGLMKDNDFVCKTIVTSDLIDRFAEKQGMECFNVLTGFKYIAEVILEQEGKKNFVVGGEESYGYLIGDQVRDKDAIASLAMICEMAADAKDQGKSLYDQLIDIYTEYGFFKERLISITKKGKEGAEDIKAMMKSFRENPPATINGSKVVCVKDYQAQTSKNLETQELEPIELPSSNVLQFFTEDGSKISARPSGTEPKIKFYFSVNTALTNKADFDKVNTELEAKIDGIITSLDLA
ncbi:phospho-sugar mutase [Sediminitomix flava]|uniref:Phosphoglucomutase n=1 Tax=Sediminitomix flava TaxID=379075 RepID=A0A315ZB90_SEDFL|nr:phospho-sugar mutase [Sediminitomix flava]PWJ41984.1 phosphoglucomutase [Sediminitomix flava]